MHPRNIYNTPPNFEELKRIYPEFTEKLYVDVTGKLKLNFKDPEALRILAICCLKKDFNLDVEIPPDKLIPALPLRINYILWIEDLLNYCGIHNAVSGVDIGCGVCCIYCLLCVRMNNWKMYGLEIDKENIRYAKENVSRNGLGDKIVIIDQEGSDKILEKLFSIHDKNYTFTICNPPFFKSKEQMIEGENRTGKRRKLDNLSTLAESSETVFSNGGELGFVTKILHESIKLKNKIDLYTSMFGCKKNLQKFIALLKDNKIDSFTTTELVQGRTFRWAVAWSFTRKISDFKSHKPSPKLEKVTPNVLRHAIQNHKLDEVHAKLMDIFRELQISIKLLKEEINSIFQYELEATENTWSNQRKKRRAKQRNEDSAAEDSSKTTSSNQNLKIFLEIKNLAENVVEISMFYIEGSMPKDCVNQILQHIKNKFK